MSIRRVYRIRNDSIECGFIPCDDPTDSQVLVYWCERPAWEIKEARTFFDSMEGAQDAYIASERERLDFLAALWKPKEED